MNNLLGNERVLWVAIITLVLIILQITFAFLMKNHKGAFRKYHPALGILIFLVIFANIIALPVSSIIGFFVLFLVSIQIILGIFILLGNKKLVRFHRPLGVFIFLVAIANLILLIP
jgi:hypothetical protein